MATNRTRGRAQQKPNPRQSRPSTTEGGIAANQQKTVTGTENDALVKTDQEVAAEAAAQQDNPEAQTEQKVTQVKQAQEAGVEPPEGTSDGVSGQGPIDGPEVPQNAGNGPVHPTDNGLDPDDPDYDKNWTGGKPPEQGDPYDPEDSSYRIAPGTETLMHADPNPSTDLVPRVAEPDGLILEQDEPLRIEGVEVGNMVVVSRDIYRRVIPWRSKRPTYVLIYSAGANIPSNTLQNVTVEKTD